MDSLKLLIVDDEPLAHSVLEGYCEKLDHVEVVGNCYDGMSTLNFLNKQQVDAVLLDIQMPDITGLELLDTLSNAPKIIFTTAYSEYALQGFDYDQVVDYLHKPIRLSRFVKAIDRLQRILELESGFSGSAPSIEPPEPGLQQPDFISIRDNKVIYKLELSDILYVQSWGNYLKFFLEDGGVKMVRKTIKLAEAELPSNRFLRIHKSYLVNIEHVKSLDGNQLKLDDQSLPIGKSYSVNVKKTISGS